MSKSCIQLLLEIARNASASKECGELLHVATEALGKFKVRQSLADDPFELFWDNPSEPRHSKLLDYFINPRSEHGCGVFLLTSFLTRLGIPGPQFPIDSHCEVLNEKGRIDLLVMRDRPDGKYAIILENKVNGASDQEQQLQRYYDFVRNKGFRSEEIWVCYLPFRVAKPSDQSVGCTGARLHIRTFKDHVVPWLQQVLNEPDSWPPMMAGDMRDNLKHYLNLLRWRLTTEKRMRMKENIFEAIHLMEQENRLPSLEAITAMRESAQELEACYNRHLCAKTLFRVRDILDEQQGLRPQLAWHDGPDVLQSTEYNFSYHIDDLVCVGFGEDKGGVFVGYNAPNRKGMTEKVFEEFVRGQDASALIGKGNDYWYNWHYPPIDATKQQNAQLLANVILSMFRKMEQLVAEFRPTKAPTTDS